MTCTFFGNRDAPEEIRPMLEKVLRNLIEQYQVTRFYVGHQGSFDRMVERSLRTLKQEYPQILYFVVLAYLPINKKVEEPFDYSTTIFPNELEKTPPRFAIDKRNRWMVQQSDFIVTYVRTPFGGAAKYKALAEGKGLQIFELADSADFGAFFRAPSQGNRLAFGGTRTKSSKIRLRVEPIFRKIKNNKGLYFLQPLILFIHAETKTASPKQKQKPLKSGEILFAFPRRCMSIRRGGKSEELPLFSDFKNRSKVVRFCSPSHEGVCDTPSGKADGRLPLFSGFTGALRFGWH